MHLAAAIERGLPQILYVAQVIALLEEAGLPVVAALDDVLRYARQIDAFDARHGVPACP